ncbi:MAG TPA: agmatine deiminase family protein [bacterium]
MSAIICFVLFSVQLDNNVFLPKYMTAEESLRIDKIGQGHVITAPPGGWVETPAEFEPLRGVWVTWIYGSYNTVEREIVRGVVSSCKAYIIPGYASDTTSIKSYLTSGGVPLDSVRFYVFPNNSVWIRDYGPWFIRRQDGTEGIIDFQYNRPRPSDDTIPWRIGQAWGIPVYGSPLEHPGGNFMVDGLGRGFFSSLIYEENPGYSAYTIDTMMRNYSGLELTAPMKRMRTEYTGHIDLWTKILNDTLVMVGDYEAGHENDTVLNNRADSITHMKNREGFNYRVVRVIMPWTTSDAPPTYLNSLFVNNKVLVPTWSLPEDPEGLAAYQNALPGYEIVGINCSSMASSGGAIHCIAMQVPASQYVHVRHYPYPDTSDLVSTYRIRCRIITSSSLRAESTLVFYKVGANGSYSTLALNSVVDTQGVYAAYIPHQTAGDTVYYYILAKNTQNIRRTSPKDVPPHLFRFRIYSGVTVGEFGSSALAHFSAFPNPARHFLNISFRISDQADLRIAIYNAAGQKVKTIVDGSCSPGHYTEYWDLSDDAGKDLPQGVYFCSVVAGKDKYTGKLLIVR